MKIKNLCIIIIVMNTFYINLHYLCDFSVLLLLGSRYFVSLSKTYSIDLKIKYVNLYFITIK